MALTRRPEPRAGRRGAARVAGAILLVGVLLGAAGCAAEANGGGAGSGGAGAGAGGPAAAAPSSPGAASGTDVPDPATDPASDRGAAGSYQNPDLGGAEAPGATSGAVPERVVIGGIGVDSGLESLSRDAEGALLPPVDFGSAGWYAQGVVPGDIGPAVIAGHIDSSVGPAVFYRLSSLKAGDTIEVAMSDGAVRTFAVDRSIQVAKADFPTEEVYGPTPTAQLRLITCGGVFDDSWGHYLDNVVVFATETPGTN